MTFDERQPIPLYVSPHRDRKHIVHLLLLTDENKRHYTLVKDLSRLVRGRTKHRGYTFVCPYCLHCFAREIHLTNHVDNCSVHAPQVTTYPKPEDAVLSYDSVQKEFPVPYVLYVDFETFQTPTADDDSVSEHIPSGFCCLKVSRVDDEIFQPYLYSGPDVIAKFFELVYEEQKMICEKLSIQKDMIPLTESETVEY